MSGGRFDYRNEDLKQIADSIEFDLANNDHVNSETSDNEVWGLNWKPETLVYVRRMLEDVKSLNRLLHEYDFAVCDDSCEDEFLQEARAIYGDLTKPQKPAVVPWEESKVGDVVEFKGQHYVINFGESPRDACEKCCLAGIPYCKGETEDSWCCYDHPSGCDVYFTEVEDAKD